MQPILLTAAILCAGAACAVDARAISTHGYVRKLQQQEETAPGPVAPSAPGTLTLIVLGDSYSDEGRRYNASNGSFPDPKWYYKGRYSNGPVWVEWLPDITAAYQDNTNQSLITVRNFAFGGAPACPGKTPNENPPKPDLKDQVAEFLASLNNATNSSAASNGLGGVEAVNLGQSGFEHSLETAHGGQSDERRVVVVQFGGNDYLNELENVTKSGDFDFGLPQLPLDVVRCITEGAIQLLEAGERHLVIMTLPPVDRTPQLQGGPLRLLRGWATKIADRHNAALRQAVAELRANYSAGNRTSNQVGQNLNVTIELYELGDVFTRLINESEAYGFKNADDSCLQYGNAVGNALSKIPLVGEAIGGFVNDLGGGNIKGMCENPSEYVFWDRVHPTARAHSLLAADFNQTVLAPALAAGV